MAAPSDVARAAAYPDLRAKFGGADCGGRTDKPLSVGARDAYGRPVIVRGAQAANAFYEILHDVRRLGEMPS